MKYKVTWTPNPNVTINGTAIGKRECMYFDTMREADRFASHYLQARTRFTIRQVDVDRQSRTACECGARVKLPKY